VRGVGAAYRSDLPARRARETAARSSRVCRSAASCTPSCGPAALSLPALPGPVVHAQPGCRGRYPSRSMPSSACASPNPFLQPRRSGLPVPRHARYSRCPPTSTMRPPAAWPLSAGPATVSTAPPTACQRQRHKPPGTAPAAVSGCRKCRARRATARPGQQRQEQWGARPSRAGSGRRRPGETSSRAGTHDGENRRLAPAPTAGADRSATPTGRASIAQPSPERQHGGSR